MHSIDEKQSIYVFLLFFFKNPFLRFFEHFFYFLVVKIFNPTQSAKLLHETTFK